MNAKVYSAKEVSELLCMGLNQTYAALKKGKIPHKRINNRYLIPKSQFHKWLEDTD